MFVLLELRHPGGCLNFKLVEFKPANVANETAECKRQRKF